MRRYDHLGVQPVRVVDGQRFHVVDVEALEAAAEDGAAAFDAFVPRLAMIAAARPTSAW